MNGLLLSRLLTLLLKISCSPQKARISLSIAGRSSVLNSRYFMNENGGRKANKSHLLLLTFATLQYKTNRFVVGAAHVPKTSLFPSAATNCCFFSNSSQH